MKQDRVVLVAALTALLAGMMFLPSTTRAEESSSVNPRKQDRPPTGSNIRRDELPRSSWTMPMEKTYDQLSPDDKNRLRRAYEEMADDDEPPYPLFGMGKAIEPISAVQGKILAEGLVLIYVRVDQSGDPISAKIVQAPKGEIGKAVAMVLMHTKFKPAKCGDQRCEMDFPFCIDFAVR
jgi:hypothetical protein